MGRGVRRGGGSKHNSKQSRQRCHAVLRTRFWPGQPPPTQHKTVRCRGGPQGIGTRAPSGLAGWWRREGSAPHGPSAIACWLLLPVLHVEMREAGCENMDAEGVGVMCSKSGEAYILCMRARGMRSSLCAGMSLQAVTGSLAPWDMSSHLPHHRQASFLPRRAPVSQLSRRPRRTAGRLHVAGNDSAPLLARPGGWRSTLHPGSCLPGRE